MVLNVWRFGITGICLLPIVLRIENKIPPSDKIKMMGLGILGIGLVGLSYTSGIAHSTAINGTILINAHPFFTMLLAPLLINEESSKRLRLLMTLGFIGTIIVVTEGFKRINLFNDSYLYGNFLIVLAALLISFYTIYLKSFAQLYGSTVATFYAVLGGFTFLLFLTVAQSQTSKLTAVSTQEFLLLLYVAAVTTALGWVIWFQAVAKIGAARGTSFMFLIPISGIIFSCFFLGEKLHLTTFVGALLSITAVVLINYQRQHNKAMDVTADRDMVVPER